MLQDNGTHLALIRTWVKISSPGDLLDFISQDANLCRRLKESRPLDVRVISIVKCYTRSVWRGGLGGRGDRVSSPPTAVSKLKGNFVHPTLPVSFGRDTKSCWSLQSGVYARRSKRSHTGGKYVTCCGLGLS